MLHNKTHKKSLFAFCLLVCHLPISSADVELRPAPHHQRMAEAARRQDTVEARLIRRAPAICYCGLCMTCCIIGCAHMSAHTRLYVDPCVKNCNDCLIQCLSIKQVMLK